MDGETQGRERPRRRAAARAGELAPRLRLVWVDEELADAAESPETLKLRFQVDRMIDDATRRQAPGGSDDVLPFDALRPDRPTLKPAG